MFRLDTYISCFPSMCSSWMQFCHLRTIHPYYKCLLCRIYLKMENEWTLHIAEPLYCQLKPIGYNYYAMSSFEEVEESSDSFNLFISKIFEKLPCSSLVRVDHFTSSRSMFTYSTDRILCLWKTEPLFVYSFMILSFLLNVVERGLLPSCYSTWVSSSAFSLKKTFLHNWSSNDWNRRNICSNVRLIIYSLLFIADI